MTSVSEKIKVEKYYETKEGQIRCLIYFTSDKIPEPLNGVGNLYCFMFHPSLDELICTNVGEWRS